MRVEKHPLVPDRVRRLPREGWSWIDRRFVREHADGLSPDAILLYFFLVAVSDKDGLSYYGNATIVGRLKMTHEAVDRARDELEHRDLIAYRPPFYQVLSLPAARPRPRARTTPLRVGEVLRRLAEGHGPKPGARP
jgi:hypothetical protein